jgi:tRNA 2-thiouridine synthesizing protein A
VNDTSATRPNAPVLLDLKGLNCPLPALRTQKALRRMPPGARLIVECTDPLSAIDVPHCVFECGDALESQSAEGDVLRFLIRRQG